VSAEGDRDAEVEALYGKWAGKVSRFLAGMGCEPWLAEEITVDAFLVARRRWGHVRTLERPEGYVFKVAGNMRKKQQPGHDARARDLRPDPAGAAAAAGGDFTEAVADRDAVRRALRQLPPRAREAVVLRHVTGLPVAEAAAIMGISEGTVKNLTFQGLAKLRSHLHEAATRSEHQW
jgi:RNA polymerase sigma factor (sigma-70 family)